MNIFHNKLWISLLQKHEFAHFSFEIHSIKQVKLKLSEKGKDFSGQTFFIQAKNSEKWINEFVDFVKIGNLGQKEARINLYFTSIPRQKKFIQTFRSFFKEQIAAGGVPIAPNGDLLMIYRFGLWDLAKGKVEEGETFEAAALREVMEETGIQSHWLGKELRATYHIFPSRKRSHWKFKTTYWWEMPCVKKEAVTPQIEEGITKVKWVKTKDLKAKMPDTYPLIKEVLREVLYD